MLTWPNVISAGQTPIVLPVLQIAQSVNPTLTVSRVLISVLNAIREQKSTQIELVVVSHY